MLPKFLLISTIWLFSVKSLKPQDTVTPANPLDSNFPYENINPESQQTAKRNKGKITI